MLRPPIGERAGLPHRNAYWVDPGRLMAGEYPGHPEPEIARRRLRDYLTCGIDSFIDLTTARDPVAPYADLLRREARDLGRSVEHRRFPIPDLGLPESPGQMAQILDAIDEGLRANRGVYVHCWAGVGRTGTVVGCFLVRHGASGGEALARLASLWSTVAKRDRKPESPETGAQRRFVRDWSNRAFR